MKRSEKGEPFSCLDEGEERRPRGRALSAVVEAQKGERARSSFLGGFGRKKRENMARGGKRKVPGNEEDGSSFFCSFFCLAVKGSCTISLAQPTSQPVLPWLFPSRSLSFSPSHPFLSSATNVGKCKRGNSSVEWCGRRHLLFLLSASPPSPLVWKFSDDASATSPTA